MTSYSAFNPLKQWGRDPQLVRTANHSSTQPEDASQEGGFISLEIKVDTLRDLIREKILVAEDLHCKDRSVKHCIQTLLLESLRSSAKS